MVPPARGDEGKPQALRETSRGKYCQSMCRFQYTPPTKEWRRSHAMHTRPITSGPFSSVW